MPPAGKMRGDTCGQLEVNVTVTPVLHFDRVPALCFAPSNIQFVFEGKSVRAPPVVKGRWSMHFTYLYSLFSSSWVLVLADVLT